MDLVQELGSRIGADLVLANDPDADRLAVSMPAGDGSWKPLTGNQIGVLLADYLLQNWSGTDRPIVINSIVSSPMLRTVADAYGAHFEQTLTGFKWIANAVDLEAQGVGTLYSATRRRWVTRSGATSGTKTVVGRPRVHGPGGLSDRAQRCPTGWPTCTGEPACGSRRS